MKKNNRDFTFLLYCMIISVILLIITIYRAVITNITGDEAYTYMHYVHSNPFYVFKYLNINGTWANNHILNSFLISCLDVFFHHNYNELIIRLPNIISYILYLIFCYLITKYTKYKYFNFALLVLNYGMNEFFGLARGYGIACCFVLIGIYFFKSYLLERKNHLLTLAYTSLLIASYANTSSLVTFAAIIFVSFIYLFKNKIFIKYTLNQIYFLIPIMIATLIIIRYHFLVTSDGLPLYGGTSGSFYSDVLESLFYTYGLKKQIISHSINIIIFILISISSRKFEEVRNSYIFLTGIFFFILLIGITKITDKYWMTGRSLIPSMPLLIMFVLEIIDTINIKKKLIFQLLAIVPLLIFFSINLDVKATRDWKQEYNIREKCYETLRNPNNTEILDFINPATEFYREKILKENGYDILN